jgi:hypothetical protein
MTQSGIELFASSPAQYFGHSGHAMQHVPADELGRMQLEALQARFAELRDRIPTLSTMADEQGVNQLGGVDDVVPLLFQHSVYKSYPLSLLVNNRFDALTNWLDRLTTYDLSGVDASGCDGIDAWLDLLDRQTELRVAHSSGTTGAMSFIPRSTREWDAMFEAFRCGLFQFSDPSGAGGQHEGEYFELIWPLYRSGRSTIMRIPEMGLKHIMGSEVRVHALRPGRMSSDSMFLAGRLQAAAARGELDKLEVNPALRERRDEFLREQGEMANTLPRFINELAAQLKGQRVWLLGTWNVLYAMAKAGLENGMSEMFAPDSLVTTGGGAKGQTVPADWEGTLNKFTGIEHVQHMYVMSEITGLHKMCEHERYHIEPWVIPFVLDPDDGTPSPRQGEHTGRAAFFDLAARTYWGGFISGDEVTVSYDPCPCGRTTSHLARRIERYSDQRGGDDKITCVAAEDAHRAALDFLTERLD